MGRDYNVQKPHLIYWGLEWHILKNVQAQTFDVFNSGFALLNIFHIQEDRASVTEVLHFIHRFGIC